MWVFFEDGTFYSAVVDEKDADVKWVRARDLRSAELFADWAEARRKEPVEILRWKNRDYAFRVMATPQEWEDYTVMQLRKAKATNFKNAVRANLGYPAGRNFLDALSSVWSTMFDFQYNELNPFYESSRKSKKKGRSHGYELASFEEEFLEEDIFDDEGFYDSGDEGWQKYQDWLQRNS